MKLSMKAARVNANLTQQKVADAMGVSIATVNLWENGKMTPKPQQFRDYCRIVGVETADIKDYEIFLVEALGAS